MFSLTMDFLFHLMYSHLLSISSHNNEKKYPLLHPYLLPSREGKVFFVHFMINLG
jgi:hypothetical protein